MSPRTSSTQKNYIWHLAHVVGPCYSIISGAVLAEAEEDGVDGHPVDGDEAVGGEVGEAGGDEDRSPGVSHIHRLRLDPHDLVGHGHRGDDHGQLAQQEDEGADWVDGSDSQCVGRLEEEEKLKLESKQSLSNWPAFGRLSWLPDRSCSRIWLKIGVMQQFTQNFIAECISGSL